MSITKVINKNGVKYKAVLAVMVNGKRESRITKRFDTKKEAKQWLSEQSNKKDSGLLNTKGNITVSQLAQNWLETSVIVNRAANTIKSFRSDFKTHILPEIGQVKLDKLSPSHIENMRASIMAKGLERATINRIMDSCKAFISYATKRRYILVDVFATYEPLTLIKKESAYWRLDDIKRFKEKGVDYPYYELFCFLLLTGVRLGEAIALTPNKVNWELNTIYISEQCTSGHKLGPLKNNNPHYLPMSKNLRKLMRYLCKNVEPNEPIFTTPKGGYLSTGGGFNKRYFTKMQEEIGIKNIITIHDLRHTYASHFVMNGGSFYELQKLLGHKSPNSTNRYAHLSPDHLHKSVERFSLSI